MNLGPECLKCGLAQDWDHARYGCEKPKPPVTDDLIQDGLRLRMIEQVVGEGRPSVLEELIVTDPLVHALVTIGRRIESGR